MNFDTKLLPEYFWGVTHFIPNIIYIGKRVVSLTFLILVIGGMTYGLKAWKDLTIDERGYLLA